MFTGNEDMEATALREQGWSISAIARHLGRDRKTIRNHLSTGQRVPGERRRSEPDPFEPFVPYLRAAAPRGPTRLGHRPLRRGGRPRVRPQLSELHPGAPRRGALRPHCEACAGVKGRATIEIEHPPGEEIQWDWDELPEAPWGGDAHLLVGSLPCSGKFRGVVRRVRGPGPSDRGHGRRAASARWQRPALAGRPHGDGRRPEDRHGPAELRARWPSTTGRASLPVRPGGATAREAWRSPSTSPPSASGAP